MKQTKYHNGFTLIEMLVVITIIAILSALTLYTTLAQTAKLSRDAKRKADTENIRAALEMYRSTNGYYPNGTMASLNAALVTVTTQYLRAIPTDPLSTQAYTYTPSPSGCNNVATLCSSYTITANLETSGTGTQYSVNPLGSLVVTPTP